MPKRRTKSPGQRRRRVIRFIVGLFLFLVGVVLACMVLVWVYPPRSAGTLVSKILTREMDRPIQIRRLDIHPSGTLQMEGLTVGFSSRQRSDSVFFSLRRLGIQLRVLPLLRRRVEISGIMIDGPTLHWAAEPGKPRERKSKEPAGKARVQDTTRAAALPLSLGLFRLRLENFSLSFPLGPEEGDPALHLSGIYLNIHDLRIPREPGRSGLMHGRVRLFTRGGQFRMTGKPNMEFPLHLDLDAQWESGDSWTLRHDMALGDTSDMNHVRLNLSIEGQGMAERASGTILLSLGGQNLVSAQADLKPVLEDTRGRLELDGDSIDLERLKKTALFLLPAEWTAGWGSIPVEGRLRLVRGGARWESTGIHFDVGSQWESLGTEDDSLNIYLAGVNGDVQIRGSWQEGSLNQGRLRAAVSADSAWRAAGDSAWTVHGISWEAQTRLNQAWMPLEGNTRLGIMSLFGGALSLEGKWKLPSLREWGKTASDWTIQADSMILNRFPGSIPLKGNTNLTLNLSTRGTRDTHLNWSLTTSRLCMPGDTLPVLRTSGVMGGMLDPDSSVWRLHSMEVHVNDCLHLNGRGKWGRKTKIFEALISDLRVENKRLESCMPRSLAEIFSGLSLQGHENVWGRAIGKTGGALGFSGGIRFQDVGISTGDSMEVRGLAGELTMDGDVKKLQGLADLVLDTVKTPYRSRALEKTRFSFQWAWDGNALTVKEANLDLPSVSLKNRIGARLALGDAPAWTVKWDAEFMGDDSIEVVKDLFMSGRWNLSLKLGSRGITGDSIALTGLWKGEDCFIRRGSDLEIRRMRGRIPLDLEADLSSMTLCAGSGFRLRPGLDYEKNRSLYRRSFPALGRLEMDTLRLNQILLRSLDLDLAFQGGEIRIPWFVVEVFDGNVGGSLHLDIAGISLDEVQYEIKAQASRINSAVLAGMEEGGGERTEVNATMAFQGRGFDLKKGIELDGSFHITQMGARFASTLLQGMDPRGSDRSIQLTRKLLNTGWKPRLFSFELRHGYVYPSLALRQPWFSPIRIPGKLEYGRLPLNFFLQSMMR